MSEKSFKPIVPPLELIKDSPDSSDDEVVESNNAGDEHINNRDVSPESGIDIASRGVTDILENEERSSSTQRTVVPPNELFNFDLTDPNEVVKMLETVELTDEDTEVLLQEAYNVNMKLKEALRRQEKGGNLNQSDIASIKGSNVVIIPGASRKGSASNSRNNSAKRSQFARAQPLPPITHGPSSSNARTSSIVYSAKIPRPVPPQSATHNQPRQKRNVLSSDVRRGLRNPSASTVTSQRPHKKQAPPTEERPAWNDRFMYQ